jgi:hypothetical protein
MNMSDVIIVSNETTTDPGGTNLTFEPAYDIVPPAELVLHARLDDMSGGVVSDSSGNSHDGTVQGNPQTVVDDRFGSVLDFDGSDYVTIPDHADLQITGDLTVEAWFYVDSAPTDWVRIVGKGVTNRNYGLWYNYTHSQFLFQQYGSAGQVNARIENTPVELNKWYHMAGVRKGSDAYLYINGLEVASVTGTSVTPYTSTDPLTIGYGDVHTYHKGKISDVRIYNKALTQLEIQQDMQDRPASIARFRMAHPLDFRLTDDNDRHVLYIDDSGQSHNLNFEIVNTSGEAVTIPGGSGTAAADNYHFELRFRPGTLSAAAITALQGVSTAGTHWNMDYVHNTNGTDSLYFLSTATQTLNSANKLKITLPNISAEPGKGARGTRVETRYNDITYRGESLDGYLEEHISIINHSGKQYLPLHTGFHLGNRVLNVGGAANTLLLRLTNTMKPDAAYPDRAKIKLSGATAAAPSKLILSFDAEADGESKDWALGTTSEVTAITVQVKKENTTGGLVLDTEWTVTKTTTGNKTQWELKHANGTTIDPGTHITIELSTVTTSLPAGLTNLYLHYENIPGYWDGQLVCHIEKSALILKDGKVGIGTSNPEGKLQVINQNQDSGGNTLILGPTNASNLRMGYHTDYSWIQSHGSKPLAINAFGNNVGIGTTSPSEKLHVNGNIKLGASSKPYYLKASRNDDPSIVSTATSWLRLGANLGIAFWANNEVDQNENPQFFIKEDGKLGIGTTNPQKSLHITRGVELQPGIRLDGADSHWDIMVDTNHPGNEDLCFKHSSTSIIYACINTDGSIQGASDLSLKTDIQPIENVLQKVIQLKPSTFKWKEREDGETNYGFIAQEVETVFPELVKDKHDIKSLKYQDFSVLAIAAIKEQQNKIDELETKLADLTQKVDTLLA